MSFVFGDGEADGLGAEEVEHDFVDFGLLEFGVFALEAGVDAIEGVFEAVEIGGAGARTAASGCGHKSILSRTD